MNLRSSGVLCLVVGVVVVGGGSSARADTGLNDGGFAHVYSSQVTNCTSLGFTLDVNEMKGAGNEAGGAPKQVAVFSVGFWDWCNGRWWSGETVVNLAPKSFQLTKNGARLVATIPFTINFNQPEQSQTPVQVEMALDWTAEGVPEAINRVNHLSLADGTQLAVHETGTRSRAQLGGMLRVGNMTIPIAVVWAEVGTARQTVLRSDSPGTKAPQR
jgi:hypothetical protein